MSMETTRPPPHKIFISHAHGDAAIAIYLERLLSRRLGDAIAVFNSSERPFAGLPLEEGVTGYRLGPSAAIAPGVQVSEPTAASAEIRNTLESAIAESSVVVAILTPRSVLSSWVSLEVQSDVFHALPKVPRIGIAASDSARSLIEQLFPYGTIVEDGVSAERENLRVQVARDEGHLTATFYFVDQASGIEALFDAVRTFVGVEPVGIIDWHQSATELRDLLRASGDKSAKV